MILGLTNTLLSKRKVGGFVGLLDLFPNAAAAYSLRKLRAAYSGAAVRVRRSSDNTEQDIGFDANRELDTASLLSFVNSDVNTFVSDFANSDPISEMGGTGQSNQSIGGRTGLYKFTYTGGATTHQAFLAGKHPDSNNTYSVFFNIYFPTGQACNGFSYLKPDGTSDTNNNLTQGVWHSFSYTDINGGSNLSRFIPSVNGVANTADDGANFYLDAWVITQTSADGFVTVWYDQSLSNNATQTTATNQPKIVSSGSLVTENGKAAVDFDGVDDIFAANALAGLSRLDLFFVTQTTDTQYVHFSGVSSLTDRGFTAQATNVLSGLTANMGTPTMYNNGVQFTGTTRDDVYVAQNGYQVISYINANTTAFSDFGIGGLGSFLFRGKFQELIGYPSNQSANRTGIEGSINEYYSIYP